MSQYARERAGRFAAVLVTGVVAGLPLLAASPAAAASPEVEFSRGGLELLSCNSQPSDGSLTVPAESTVTFVNKLGEDATLRIDGRNASRVERGGSSEVIFHRGTVRVEMVPDCGLSLTNSFDPVSVTVQPAGGGSGEPSSQEPDPPTGGGPADQGGNGRGEASGQPDRNGTDESPAPDASASASPSGAPVAPGDGGVSDHDAGTVEGPAAGGGEQGLAAEPLSSVQAPSERGPNGLLAIIAAICVVGVSAGAIRAIIAQRATRTSVA